MIGADVISLFPAGANVGVGITDPRRPVGDLYASERIAIERAVPKRQAEFRAGRVAARKAMGAVGMAPAPVPSLKDRAPDWPAGLSGSITHCDDMCVACVSRDARAIGVDIENAQDLPAELWPEILLPQEQQAVAKSTQPGRMAKLIFSAKEAAYKAQYPLSGALFGFHDLAIQITGPDQFEAQFRIQAGAFQPGDRMQGRYVVTDNHVLTGVTLT